MVTSIFGIMFMVIFCTIIIVSFPLTSYLGRKYYNLGIMRLSKYIPSIFFLLMSLFFFYLAYNEKSLGVVLFVLIGIALALIFVVNFIIALVYEFKYHH